MGAMFSGDGSRVLTASADGSAVVWNAENGEVIQVFEASSSGARYAEFSMDGKFLLTAQKDGASYWSVENEEECLQTYPGHGGLVSAARLSPANFGVALCNSD